MILSNDKVSSRQLYRMIVTSMVGITCMTQTSLAVRISGVYGGLSLVVAMAFAVLYTAFILYICKRVNWNWEMYVSKHPGLRIINVLFIIKYFLMLIFVMAVLVRTIRLQLLGEMGYIGISIPVFIILVYSVKSGIEARGRLAECIIYPILIQIVILAVLGVREMDVSLITEVSSAVQKLYMGSPWNILYCGIVLAVVYAPVEMILFMSGRFNTRYNEVSKYKKSVWYGIVTVFIINIVYYFVLVGNLGIGMISQKENILAELANDIKMPYLVFEKQDGLFMVFFVLSIFFSLFCLGFHIINLGEEVFGERNAFSYAAIVIITLTGVYFIANHTSLLPNITGEKEKRVEIDKREYVDTIIADYDDEGYRLVIMFKQGESGQEYREFRVAKVKEMPDEYERSSDKVWDLSHVQAVIMSDRLLSDSKRYAELVSFLEDNSEISGNMNLGTTSQDMDTFLKGIDNISPAPGKYISNMIENNDNIKNSSYKDLRLVMYEDKEKYNISVFTAADNRLTYEGQIQADKNGKK